MIEANKFWFYAICLSIARNIGKLFFRPAVPNKIQSSQVAEEKRGRSQKPSPSKAEPSTSSLVKQLVIDSCDLTLPASFIGWVSLGNVGIGMAMVVSTLLAGQQLWSKIQN